MKRNGENRFSENPHTEGAGYLETSVQRPGSRASFACPHQVQRHIPFSNFYHIDLIIFSVKCYLFYITSMFEVCFLIIFSVCTARPHLSRSTLFKLAAT